MSFKSASIFSRLATSLLTPLLILGSSTATALELTAFTAVEYAAQRSSVFVS